MIVGHGIDLMSTGRIAAAIERFGERFIRRVYTDREVETVRLRTVTGEDAYPGQPGAAERPRWPGRAHQMFTAFWAVKEAAMKALGTGNRQGVAFRDIEVHHLRTGQPYLMLHGRSAEHARRLGMERIAVSMTHLDDLSAASVIFESG
jgi:holo-[acyl-carrier protein] synthase